MTIAGLATRIKSLHAWRELAGLLFIPADVVWLTGWYCLLTGVDSGHDMFRILGVLILSNYLAYLVLRGLFSAKIPVGLRLVLGAVGIGIGLWLGENLLAYRHLVFDPRKILVDIWTGFSGLRSLSKEFWALVAMCVVWLRCILYARKPVTQDTVVGRSLFSLIMMLILLVLPDRPGLAIILAGVSLFLVFALSSLSLARIADNNLFRGGKRLSFKFDWLAALVGISIFVVSFAGAFAFLASSWLVLAVLSLTEAFLFSVRYLIENVILPLTALFAPFLQKLIVLLIKPEDVLKMPDLDLEPRGMVTDLEKIQIEQTSAEALRAAQPYIISILVGLVLVGVILVLIKKPWKEQLKDIDDPSREIVEGNLWKRLRSSLGHPFQALLGSVNGQIRLRRAAGRLRAARIRWIYHQLEVHSARRGVPRPAAVTPLEYQSMLAPLFPGGGDELGLLTGAYLSVRYGELPETAGEVTAVVKAWERLKTLHPTRGAGTATRGRKS